MTKIFTLSGDEQTIQIVWAGLHELPGRICNPVLANFQKQLAAQQFPARDTSATPQLPPQDQIPASTGKQENKRAGRNGHAQK